MGEGIFEFKPGIGGFTVDVLALLRRLAGKSRSGRVSIVAERFLTVFGEHGVAPAQIQQFLPEITLDKLNSNEALLAALSNTVLDQTAAIFAVRREWLDGVEDEIYERHWCYKSPRRLFEALTQMRPEFDCFPVRALYSSKELNSRDPYRQRLVLVLVEKVRELGEETIHRYQIWDECDWSHFPCRVQLKAMVRTLDRDFGLVVPLYRVDDKTLTEVIEGRCIPRKLMDGSPVTDPSLEDYALSAAESKVAKECEELGAVMNYIDLHNLGGGKLDAQPEE